MRYRLVAIAFCRSVAEHGDETHVGLRVRVVAIMYELLVNLTLITGSHCYWTRNPSFEMAFPTPVVHTNRNPFPPKSDNGEKCQSGGFPRVG